MKISSRLLLAVALLSLSLPVWAQENVVLIVGDDMGVDTLAVYGEAGDYPVTPNLDGLATQGVSFRNVWSTPVCSSTRATILTGRYGFRNTVGALVKQSSGGHDLPLCESLLPESLCPVGYRTAAVGKWHLTNGGYNAPPMQPCLPQFSPLVVGGPIHHGFDYFAGSLFNFSSPSQHYFNWQRFEPLLPDGTMAAMAANPSLDYATRQNVDDAIHWLENSGDDPFFLYLAFHSPHVPLQVPPAGEFVPRPGLDSPGMLFDPNSGHDDRAFFKAMVESMDHQIGRLLARLECLGLRENTWIIFVGDNGTTEDVNTSDRPGKGTLFEGGINVPLIVSGPLGWIDEPRRFHEGLVNTTDLFATVCDMAGAALPAGVTLDSYSLLPVLEDHTASTGRALAYSELFPHSGAPGPKDGQAIRNERYKYILHSANSAESFFDLEVDPLEQDNLLLDVPGLTLNERNNLAALKIALSAHTDTPLPCPDPCSSMQTCP